MKVKSIAECFWPALSNTFDLHFGLFESGRFTQVLLYNNCWKWFQIPQFTLYHDFAAFPLIYAVQ